jgi:hypothetical protein
VHESGELKHNIFANALTVETGEKRRGCSSIKTFSVVKNPDSQSALSLLPHVPGEATRDAIDWQPLSTKTTHPGVLDA